jgi:hypothetical protein
MEYDIIEEMEVGETRPISSVISSSLSINTHIAKLDWIVNYIKSRSAVTISDETFVQAYAKKFKIRNSVYRDLNMIFLLGVMSKRLIKKRIIPDDVEIKDITDAHKLYSFKNFKDYYYTN